MSATRSKQKKQSKQTTMATRAPREGTVMWAVIQVLAGKRKPLKPAEILAEIQERRLAKKLKGKTPEASVAARLAVHAKAGLYVERPEKGKYQLKRGTVVPRAASAAPAASVTRARSARKTSTSRVVREEVRATAPDTAAQEPVAA